MNMIYLKKAPNTITVWTIIFSVFFIPMAYSQTTVEQATKETYRPRLKEIQKKITVKPTETPLTIEKEEKPDVEGEVSFYIESILLKGTSTFQPEEFKSIVSKYENREITLSELERLSKEIEEAYLERGIIATCFVPPQEISEKIATLQIIEAKLGKIKIKKHKYFNPDRVNYYWNIKPQEVLRYDKISRSLKLISKNPDRDVKATIYAGEQPQTSDIQLNVETQFPIHMTYTYDLEGIPSSGRQRTGWGIRHNNLFGFDDMFLAGHTFGKYFDSIHAYHIIPISKKGASLLYGYNTNKSFPKGDFESLDIDSRSKNSSVIAYQDLFHKGDYLGEIHGGLDIKDKTTKSTTGTNNRDRLRIVRLGGALTFSGLRHVSNFDLEFSQGLDLFGARKQHPLSSRAAKTKFSKVTIGAQYSRALTQNIQANIKLKGQVASTKLTPQEEFSLGGIDSVRGYPTGDYLADSAFQTNVELLLPAFFIPESVKIPYAANSLRESITPVLFYDSGFGERRGDLSTETKSVNFQSVGAGLRINFFDQASIKLEWGYPFGDATITEAGRLRFHFSVDFEDQIPREVKRIRKLLAQDETQR